MCLATLAGYFSQCCPPTHPIALLVPSCQACGFSSPPKFHFRISSKTYQPSATESIWHYRNCPMAASSWISPNNLEHYSPNAVVYLEAHWDGSALCKWTNASYQETQPPRLASICWTHCSQPAPSFWPIASEKISFAPGWLVVSLLYRPSPTNHHSHYLPPNCHMKLETMCTHA